MGLKNSIFLNCQQLGDPIGMLIVMMVLKTLVDLAMHQAERNKYEGI